MTIAMDLDAHPKAFSNPPRSGLQEFDGPPVIKGFEQCIVEQIEPMFEVGLDDAGDDAHFVRTPGAAAGEHDARIPVHAGPSSQKGGGGFQRKGDGRGAQTVALTSAP